MSNGNKKLNLFFSNNIFLGSFVNIQNIPNTHLPECCFIGRSNVGKSSIINSITKTKNLAKTSKTPGRTQQVNLFEINKKINIVDLPGYGYAKVSKKINHKLIQLIESYILERKNLINIYVLIDCKIGLKNSDLDLFDFLLFEEKKFSIILTKTDKCSFNFIAKQNNSIKTHMENYKKKFNKIFLTNNKNKEGILDVQKDIFNLSIKS